VWCLLAVAAQAQFVLEAKWEAAGSPGSVLCRIEGMTADQQPIAAWRWLPPDGRPATCVWLDVYHAGAGTVRVDWSVRKTGDITGDGLVDVADVLALASEWGSNDGQLGDLNADGFVDISDLLIVAQVVE